MRLATPLPLSTLPPNHFGALRIALAGMVAVSLALGAVEIEDPLFRDSGQVSLAEAGTCGLFMIAGLLGTDSLLRRGPARFLLRRAVGLYLVLLLADFVMVLIVSPLLHGGIATGKVVEALWRTAIFEPVPIVLPASSDHAAAVVNEPLLAVAFLARCYVLLALLWPMRRWLAWIAGGIFVGAFVVALTGVIPRDASLPGVAEAILLPPAPWPVFLMYFFAGVLLRMVHGRFKLRRFPLIVALAALVGLAPIPGTAAILLPTAGVYLLYHLAMVRAGGNRYRGHVAYGLIAFAMPAAVVVAHLAHDAWPKWATIVTALAVTAVASVAVTLPLDLVVRTRRSAKALSPPSP